MRITRYAALATAAVLVLGAGACEFGKRGSADPSGEPTRRTDVHFDDGTTMAKLHQAKKIKIGVKFDQPGFGYQDTKGKMSGFDIEIAKIISAELGIPLNKIEWKRMSATIREQAIEQGIVDLVVATYSITEARKERVAFAGPYYVGGQQIMVRADDTSIIGPESLKAGTKKVCSVINSTPASVIRGYLKSEATQLMLLDVYQKCVDALKARRVDAVTTDNVLLIGFLARNKGTFRLAGDPFTENPYGIGLKKDDEQFRAYLNDVLTKAVEEGWYQQAWKKTAGQYDQNVPTAPPIDRG